jgi:hypothetical protein
MRLFEAIIDANHRAVASGIAAVEKVGVKSLKIIEQVLGEKVMGNGQTKNNRK